MHCSAAPWRPRRTPGDLIAELRGVHNLVANRYYAGALQEAADDL